MTDVLIIGAGSAGSVLAERLSADERCTVTVVEWGPSATDARVADQIADGLRLPIGPASSVVHRYPTVLTDDPRRTAQLMRGAVVGGSGAVNGGYFCRALPTDFDGWGLPGWAWADVLPHFRAIEHDLDFDTPVHGQDGPITVRRVAVFDGATGAFVDAARAAGYPWVEDLNGATAGLQLPAGIGAVPLNIDGGQRVGPGGAFLQPVLGRPNLTVHTETRVQRLLLQGTRAVGVQCRGPDGASELFADRIILCAGAIETARLLLLSGIGPAAQVRAADVPVVADLPVGVATIDHPEWVLPVRWTPTHGVPPLEAILTTDKGVEIRPYTAGFGAMVGGDHDDPADHPHLGITLMRPHSRGRVRLRGTDPVIEHRYDSAPLDVLLLSEATELARELAGAAAEGQEAVWATSQHLCGTAKMGSDDDPDAMVDNRCHVFGVDGLSIVDGSILPMAPSRGPHATIAMIGHRAAEFFA
ncbi:mycofactocin system GMC family oxidoreductase MftG [Mycolicibacterium duvalii]|uniref:Glucose-methanol-choline oxidoreductase n=1 Tax=Mycolicibacterium duvalii TaxID=39688 RepID=A0A7I7K3B6_9MYCO|nr:mycofactocin system GMC family oxidoreductase MftG [Mycolicibacterium duvalii]MCV7367853.1 mycofactocin system GMC family oxidoreductase MftG [Mycolicibacterium duvalii]PEG42620.1 mycofactocin system GMC family oxidoreductase MftG [Mycolicibacterium duvalii]BBX18557.1 glucose-methanol-choline oxidoreductase [Mycolicibacterium duvalii]